MQESLDSQKLLRFTLVYFIIVITNFIKPYQIIFLCSLIIFSKIFHFCRSFFLKLDYQFKSLKNSLLILFIKLNNNKIAGECITKPCFATF